MSNGTVAIYCALKSLGIGKEDEVIVPDLTFIATANAVSAVKSSVPSIDRLTTPDLSVIVSPSTTKTRGVLKDIIVTMDDSKYVIFLDRIVK